MSANFKLLVGDKTFFDRPRDLHLAWLDPTDAPAYFEVELASFADKKETNSYALFLEGLELSKSEGFVPDDNYYVLVDNFTRSYVMCISNVTQR